MVKRILTSEITSGLHEHFDNDLDGYLRVYGVHTLHSMYAVIIADDNLFEGF